MNALTIGAFLLTIDVLQIIHLGVQTHIFLL